MYGVSFQARTLGIRARIPDAVGTIADAVVVRGWPSRRRSEPPSRISHGGCVACDRSCGLRPCASAPPWSVQQHGRHMMRFQRRECELHSCRAPEFHSVPYGDFGAHERAPCEHHFPRARMFTAGTVLPSWPPTRAALRCMGRGRHAQQARCSEDRLNEPLSPNGQVEVMAGCTWSPGATSRIHSSILVKIAHPVIPGQVRNDCAPCEKKGTARHGKGASNAGRASGWRIAIALHGSAPLHQPLYILLIAQTLHLSIVICVSMRRFESCRLHLLSQTWPSGPRRDVQVSFFSRQLFNAPVHS